MSAAGGRSEKIHVASLHFSFNSNHSSPPFRPGLNQTVTELPRMIELRSRCVCMCVNLLHADLAPLGYGGIGPGFRRPDPIKI